MKDTLLVTLVCALSEKAIYSAVKDGLRKRLIACVSASAVAIEHIEHKMYIRIAELYVV